FIKFLACALQRSFEPSLLVIGQIQIGRETPQFHLNRIRSFGAQIHINSPFLTFENELGLGVHLPCDTVEDWGISCFPRLTLDCAALPKGVAAPVAAPTVSGCLILDVPGGTANWTKVQLYLASCFSEYAAAGARWMHGIREGASEQCSR